MPKKALEPAILEIGVKPVVNLQNSHLEAHFLQAEPSAQYEGKRPGWGGPGLQSCATQATSWACESQQSWAKLEGEQVCNLKMDEASNG